VAVVSAGPYEKSFALHSRQYTHTYKRNHFTALLDFVRDYPGEPAPER